MAFPAGPLSSWAPAVPRLLDQHETELSEVQAGFARGPGILKLSGSAK
jgi:hypothetical protein